MDTEGFQEARDLLASADVVSVLSGAGVSAESGVPTFRGEEGLWKSYQPEELATPQAFRRDPRLVWEWYDWRRGKIRACKPNPGHEALARFALGSRTVRIVTQNVDGLHEEAARKASGGNDPSPGLPLELHGSIFRVKCTSCTYKVPHRDPISADSLETLPKCPVCGSLLRPDVVWFGESLDAEILSEAFRVAQGSQVCLVVGTSALVHPAASVPLATRDSGGRIIEVNPTETPLSPLARVSLRGASGEVLPPLLEGLD
ncbi:MAG: NAD-dependent deacylase [Gemmatimonadetes bacterium]|nr:NAD-dependent deacylase [Gemmatimonadota bacterium]